MAPHAGTHIDTLCHLMDESKNTMRLPLENSIGEEVVIDVTAKVHGNLQFTLRDLEFFENRRRGSHSTA